MKSDDLEDARVKAGQWPTRMESDSDADNCDRWPIENLLTAMTYLAMLSAVFVMIVMIKSSSFFVLLPALVSSFLSATLFFALAKVLEKLRQILGKLDH